IIGDPPRSGPGIVATRAGVRPEPLGQGLGPRYRRAAATKPSSRRGPRPAMRSCNGPGRGDLGRRAGAALRRIHRRGSRRTSRLGGGDRAHLPREAARHRMPLLPGARREESGERPGPCHGRGRTRAGVPGAAGATGAVSPWRGRGPSMNDAPYHLPRDLEALRYLDAVDAGDLEAVAEAWERAGRDPGLQEMLGELDGALSVDARGNASPLAEPSGRRWRRRAAWAGVSGALAASCLIAVLARPRRDYKDTIPSPERDQPVQRVSSQPPDDSTGLAPL